MGRHTVSLLLDEGADVWLLNRGKTRNPFPEQRVKVLKCDRMNEQKKFRRLLEYGGEEELEASASTRVEWDAVIDFVCFRRKGIEDILLVSGCIKHYVFVSSDSVFMACERSKIEGYQSKSGLKEEHAIPINNKQSKREAKERNYYQYEYGGGKLDCELCLQENSGKFDRYTILRLPDVIGPFDNLGSFLNLQKAILGNHVIGTRAIPDVSPEAHQISLCYAPDVAKPTIPELIKMVAEELKVECKQDPGLETELVSVDFGPICNEKAKQLLQWEPTEVVRQTVEWYKDEENMRYTAHLADSRCDAQISWCNQQQQQQQQRVKYYAIA
eukprot:761600-Hanusia_phi.AAC.4